MKGIYLTEQSKQEIEAKIKHIEVLEINSVLSNFYQGQIAILKEILCLSTILPVEESWDDVLSNTERTDCLYSCRVNTPQGVIIQPKQHLEKEMFELEQELDIPSPMRWHNSNEVTLEEAAKNTTNKYINEREMQTAFLEFIEGAKWMSERRYSEEEVEEIFKQAQLCTVKADGVYFKYETFEQFKKNKL
jgi:hypothetical protein